MSPDVLSDLFWLIARCNLVLGAAILAVMALRAPARVWFGARVAYALWLIPPLACAMCFAPLRVEHVVLPAEAAPLAAPQAFLAPLSGLVPTAWPGLALCVWAGGVLLHLGVLVLRQRRFARSLGRLAPRADLGARVFAAQSCAHGPAVIGVLWPMIVTPADFDRRFSDVQRRIVLAHERAHMAQGDPLINAVVATVQCANWFNPLVHVAARALRVDQELACDAAVLTHPESARRLYAEAILQTQIATDPAPLGCAWPSPSLTALKERIAMLKRNRPSRAQRLLGASAITIAALGACAAAWSAQPTRLVVTTAPSTEEARAEAALHGAAKVERARARRAEQALAHADAQSQPDESDAEDADGDEDLAGGIRSEHGQELTPERRAEIMARVHRAMERARAHQLSAEDQARIQLRVREALQHERGEISAEEQARIAERVAHALDRQSVMEARSEEIQRRVERRVETETAHVRVRMTPDMRAEIHALSASAARVATLAAAAHDQARSAEMEAAQAEVERHAARVQELAEQARAEAERGQHD